MKLPKLQPTIDLIVKKVKAGKKALMRIVNPELTFKQFTIVYFSIVILLTLALCSGLKVMLDIISCR